MDHTTGTSHTMTATYRGCSTIRQVVASDHAKYILDPETTDFLAKTNHALEERDLTLAYVEKCGRCSRTAMAHQLYQHYCGTGDLCPEEDKLLVTVTTVDGHEYVLNFEAAELPTGLPGRTLDGSAQGTQLPWLAKMYLNAARTLADIARDYVQRNQTEYKYDESGIEIDMSTYLPELVRETTYWSAFEINIVATALGITVRLVSEGADLMIGVADSKWICAKVSVLYQCTAFACLQRGND